jgi:DUF4097 and DUF4098 domain-containing protein YvlB
MNKSLAVFRIIMWSFIAFFSILIIIFIAMGWLDDFYLGGYGKNMKVISEKNYNVNEIDNINIKWFSDSVYISSYEGDKIIVTEKSNREPNDEDLLNISKNDGTLTLEQKRHINFFNIFNFRTLVREIKLPVKLYKQITVDFTSGKLEMNDVKTSTLNLRMTSGKSIVNDVETDKLLVDITSGSANLNGKFMDIKALETSGSTNIESDVAPSKLSVNVTSGSANITIPDNDGFILGTHKTSGSFRTDFDTDDFGKYKKGTREYLIRMTSGSVKLLKK